MTFQPDFSSPDAVLVFFDNALSSVAREGERGLSKLPQKDRDDVEKIFNSEREKFDKSLKECVDTMQFGVVNIAFYGETNAGKSTVIETLRIMMDDPKKQEDREKFGAAQGDEQKQFCDGVIIGMASDFTRKCTHYNWSHAGHDFSLVDLPGIEGRESDVIAEIERAMKKSHVVFYVTADPRPPQTGDKGHDGPLQKIRQHLNNQARVYTIYNEKIQSPDALDSFSGDCDLSKLDDKMREELGTHYQKSFALSAGPAFRAVADCLCPDSRDAKLRTKFQARFGDCVVDKSRFTDFIQLLTDDILPAGAELTREANTKKIRGCVDDFVNNLAAVRAKRETHYNNEKKEWQKLKKELSAQYQVLEKNADKAVKAEVEEFINEVSEEVLRRGSFYGKDDFEKAFKDYGLEKKINLKVQDEVEKFKKKNIFGRAQSRWKELSGLSADALDVYENYSHTETRETPLSTYGAAGLGATSLAALALVSGPVGLAADVYENYSHTETRETLLSTYGAAGLGATSLAALAFVSGPVGWTAFVGGGVAALSANFFGKKKYTESTIDLREIKRKMMKGAKSSVKFYIFENYGIKIKDFKEKKYEEIQNDARKIKILTQKENKVRQFLPKN